jgi:hypothetical protein
VLAGLPFGSTPIARAGDTQCTTQACFSEQVSRCEAATFDTQHVAGGQARYKIFGPWGGGCAIDFVFLENPDSSLAGPVLSFVVYPEQELEPQLKEAVAGCLQGKQSKYQCSGPLWDMASGGDAVELRMASEPPCGVEIEDEGESFYPMPLGGRWGYVNLDGEWAIEPRWIQAQPFSEGRAAVDGGAERGGLWGIIDRQGNYVLEPFLKSDVCSSDGLKLCKSPVRPYSEGCASAKHMDGDTRYFFIARDGSVWHYDRLPAGVTEENFEGFGDFSEGKAWFGALVFGADKNSHGWIDASGEVAIPRQYSGGGNFVGNLAPAAQGGDFWAFMDTRGNPTLPDRWKYQKARAFSEGLAAVQIDVFTSMYLGTDGTIIDKVNFRKPRGSGANEKTSAKIEKAGDFHDGLAAIYPHGLFADSELIFIRPDGSEAFAPQSDLGLTLCRAGSDLPEFHDGLIRLLVANEGEDCGDLGAVYEDRAHYDQAHFVYLDTTGRIVLEQPWREGDTDVKP